MAKSKCMELNMTHPVDHSKCCFSTGICGSITAGQGKLDENGYWEFPCPECAIKANEMDNESTLKISHEVGLRAVQFISNMKLTLDRKHNQNKITDEEVLHWMEASAILDQVKTENNLPD